MPLFRRRRLPAERRPDLAPDERIIDWASVAGDDMLVVTNLGAWLPGAASRLGWHEIHKATWSGRQLALVASREVGVDRAEAGAEGVDGAEAGTEGVDGAEAGTEGGYTVVEDLPAVVHTLLDPGDVPLHVRSRVTKSIAYTSHHPLPAGGGVRVVARRVPGVNGLRWTVRYDDGTDRDADSVRAATADLVAIGRAGIEDAVR
jgi:hypothetical protein